MCAMKRGLYVRLSSPSGLKPGLMKFPTCFAICPTRECHSSTSVEGKSVADGLLECSQMNTGKQR
jgi:hypothetical protein